MLYKSIEYNRKELNSRLKVDKSFDLVERRLLIKNTESSIYFVDGFVKDDIMLWINEVLQEENNKFEKIEDIELLMKKKIGYVEVELCTDIDQFVDSVLMGMSGLVIDGFSTAILIDSRTYPARGPEEPDLEKVTRGSRDGLVETLVFNTALIRRRIRDENLVYEIYNVGSKSKTDVVIGYLENEVDKDLLKTVINKIESIEIDSLVMNEKSLEEKIIRNKWYNPLPNVRFSERPDVVAAHIIEGHIVIIVDNSPSVMIIPTTIFHFTQHAEDYIQKPLVGNYIRFIRYFLLLSSFLLVPLWLLLVEYVEILPEFLKFLGPKETSFVVPLFIQFIILELGLDGLRLASIHTPNSLSTSLGIIGALILSQFAIDVGWFIPETILYMAIVGLGQFATPSVEFSYAIRVFRLVLLIFVGVLSLFGYGIVGFIIGIIYVMFCLFNTNTIGNVSYLWPLIPFNGKALRKIIFRHPIAKLRK